RNRSGARVRTKLAAHFEAVELRQHQVEHDEIRRAGADLAKRGSTAARRATAEALALQVEHDQAPDVGFGFDDENVATHRTSTPESCRINATRATAVCARSR